MRDYVSHQVQNVSSIIDDLERQERAAEGAKRQKNQQHRAIAEENVRRDREQLLREAQPAVVYELLVATQKSDATAFRTVWQNQNRLVTDCLQPLLKNWREGRDYWRIFATPTIDLAILPAYSWMIQFTFTLAQPYISRDEQDFYIIDNPVRKDKVFRLPYVASTSWKGSLRAALWQLEHREEDERIRRLFGNEKGAEGQENFRAGRLYFYPTFFIHKSLEIINPQNRAKRAGENPILFESVPEGTTGIFTLLYVPFDLIGELDETSKQVVEDLRIVIKGLQAMFRIYGFGAKTHSGFGLVKETVQKAFLEVHVAGVQKITAASSSFEQMIISADRLTRELRS